MRLSIYLAVVIFVTMTQHAGADHCKDADRKIEQLTRYERVISSAVDMRNYEVACQLMTDSYKLRTDLLKTTKDVCYHQKSTKIFHQSMLPIEQSVMELTCRKAGRPR